MRRLLQPANARSKRRFPRSEPAWLRLVAMLCVLLVGGGACVQASHVHDDGGPALGATAQHLTPIAIQAASPARAPAKSPSDMPVNSPDHCLLCVVMHAAMPAVRGVAPVPIRHAQPAIRAVAIARRVQRVSFDLFSRPPPASLTHATEAGLAEELRAL